MTEAILFFVLVGLVCTVAAQWICWADERVDLVRSVTIARVALSEWRGSQAETRRLDSVIERMKEQADERCRTILALTAYKESASKILGESRDWVDEALRVTVAVVQNPIFSVARPERLTARFTPNPEFNTPIKVVHLEAMVVGYTMSVDMLAIKDEKWLRAMLVDKFSRKLAEHLADNLTLV